jgi:hypothetical protein
MVSFVKQALSRRTVRTVAISLIAFAALVSGAVLVPAAADAQSPPAFSQLTNIRVGRHATYDRVVLDFRGPLPSSFRANWVNGLFADASGKPVPLPGNKFVSVNMHNASSFDLSFRPTYTGPRKFNTPQLRNVVAVTITGDFEHVLSIGLGTRRHTWLHVFTLTAPNRLVIDIGR